MAIILIGVENPGNLGAVARVMKNFGETELILVDPKCSITDFETEQRAMNAKDVLNTAKIMSFEDVKPSFDLLIGLSARLGTDYNLARSPITPRELSEKISKRIGKIGFVFGRESSGLTNEELKICDLFVNIPTTEKYKALNLSHSVAIILYEQYINAKNSFDNKKIALLEGREMNELISKMQRVIESLDWETEDKKNTQKIVWKRLFAKSFLTRREGFALMGLLSKLENKQ